MSKKDEKNRSDTPGEYLSAKESAGVYKASGSAADGQLKILNETLVSIIEETSTSEGIDFFRQLVIRIADTLSFRYAMVAEVTGGVHGSATSLVFYNNGSIVENVTYDLLGTPCDKVVEGRLCVYPQNVSDYFSEDQILKDLNIESYIGISLLDSKGKVLGILNAFDTEPIKNAEFCRTIFTVFSQRAGFELDRLRFENDRRQDAELLEAIMDNCPASIYIKNLEGRHIFVNRWLSNMPRFKDKHAVGLTDYDLMPHDVADILKENDLLTLESGFAQTFEETLHQPDGTEQTFLSVKFPLPSMQGCICGISTDITERKKLEGALVRAGKLESIGTLAGGIAHDFNNVLLGVLGNASIAKAYLHSDHKVWSLLDDIEKAAERAKVVTRQLLTFSRGDVMIKEIVEAGPLVYNRTKLLLKGHDIDFNTSLPESLWRVEVDETMVGEVFEHIMLNAIQSMPDGGIIELRASNITVEDEEFLPLENGKYVKIEIEDHGVGISQENLPLLFDPFYTTKECSSGLGLAVSYSIVRKHCGTITAESKAENQGATFCIYLPAVDVEPEPNIHGEKRVQQEGKILVMDDEDIIRDVSGEMLKLLGYKVEFALDGKEAIERFKGAKESGAPYKAIIMDLTIPNGMGGKEAIEELIKIDPDVKVIVSSGYSRDPVMANFKEFGFSAVLVKPYKFEEFSRVVSSVVVQG